LQARIEENERQRSQYQQDLQSKIHNEMSELKGMIDREEQERKLADDEIIIALEKYTQQLQNSLSVISS
jgi:protein associated with RNAse G/E